MNSMNKLTLAPVTGAFIYLAVPVITVVNPQMMHVDACLLLSSCHRRDKTIEKPPFCKRSGLRGFSVLSEKPHEWLYTQ